MELQERISILKQGTELAQKNGVLTLDDAYYAKQALDALKNGVSVKEAFDILIKIVNIGQKNGVYSLRDSHFIFLATENYEQAIAPQPAPQPTPQPTPQTAPAKRTTKKES